MRPFIASASPPPLPHGLDRLDNSARAGTSALLGLQRADGHWAFELEADATIPAEYILLDHFLDTINQPLHERMAKYLREIQEEHGGWPLFHRGDLNISASVKAYFALKCVGDDINAPHMIKAREAILSRGGAAKSNVFTRIQLALFGAAPWRAVPIMPVEIMLLPRWFPFHLSKIAYWSRTVIVPLLVLMAKKPQAKNPRKVNVDELFTEPQSQVKDWNSNATKSILNPAFRILDEILRFFEPMMPKWPRRKAIDKAVAWVAERLNGEDGLGAIYPAMANAVMMYDCLGYPADHADAAIARKSIDKMVVDTPDRAYCQPCLSPVWDTGLACHALLEANQFPSPQPLSPSSRGEGLDRSGVKNCPANQSGGSPSTPLGGERGWGEGDFLKTAIERGCDWLIAKQILDVVGDWSEWRPGLRPGGWAFQYANPHYPDLDDTAVVVMALDRLDRNKYRAAIDRAVEWVLGMQSKNGGWGAFDADNVYYYLNHIPFADHGALLDPPSADVTARCVSMLAQLGYDAKHPAVNSAVEYLRREQEIEGCWFGRWGTNYIYGTWSVLCALNAAGLDAKDPMVRRAVDWLLSRQREDGGWGEDGASYWEDKPKGECAVSTPAQTAWALLGLMAVGEVDNPAVKRGIDHLLDTQKSDDGLWDESYYTAVGFPRVFYLRYHGYKAFFPLWAIARYRNLRASNSKQVMYGM